MLRLIEVNEQNWMDVRNLSVSEAQSSFLDCAGGIVARGYIYRADRAEVIGIADDDTVIGVALVKDLDEEPACYDLQQFMIDQRYQGKGYGTAALKLLLSRLETERKYDCVEVCVKKEDLTALHVYEKVGFADTGYVDEEAPDSLNLMYHFQHTAPAFRDIRISDFSDASFQSAFRSYFAEIGLSVKDWDKLFREMNDEGGNQAFIRMADNGNVIGFIQFKPIVLSGWFFEETCGFIREFWVSETYRHKGHGAALLRLAEESLKEHGIYTSILTTYTAERFYLKHGYQKAPGCRAKNNHEVFIKHFAG